MNTNKKLQTIFALLLVIFFLCPQAAFCAKKFNRSFNFNNEVGVYSFKKHGVDVFVHVKEGTDSAYNDIRVIITPSSSYFKGEMGIVHGFDIVHSAIENNKEIFINGKVPVYQKDFSLFIGTEPTKKTPGIHIIRSAY